MSDGKYTKYFFVVVVLCALFGLVLPWMNKFGTSRSCLPVGCGPVADYAKNNGTDLGFK